LIEDYRDKLFFPRDTTVEKVKRDCSK